jgi:protein-disulfide isomerase
MEEQDLFDEQESYEDVDLGDQPRKPGTALRIGTGVIVLIMIAAAVLQIFRPQESGAAGTNPGLAPDAPVINAPPTTLPMAVGDSEADAAPEAVPTPTMQEAMEFLAEGVPFLGTEDAPVIIVEFSDFMCPYCAYFGLETLPLLLEAYPDEIKFAHRDYLNFGETSYRVALSAACAAEQDLYWEMRDSYYRAFEGIDLEEFHSLPKDEAWFDEFLQGYNDEMIFEFADAAGVDRDLLAACMDEERYQQQIALDYQLGMQIGIEGIPFFIVNGTLINGAMPYQDFVGVIELALDDLQP